MLTSLALIFLVGLSLASISQKLRLPRIIGMLAAGILLGPYALNLLDGSIISISPELRQMALVIILIKAGLSLNIDDLKKVGRPAILLSFLPALLEILAFVLIAPLVLHINHIEAAVMGAILGAVSPAVVVPRMVQLMDEAYGTDKRIPQMILAGASLDDVFVIVLFSTFVGMAQGNHAQIMDFVNIPISIVLGILLGAVAGFALTWFFEQNYTSQNPTRTTQKVIIILSVSFLLLAAEGWLEGIVSVSGLLAIMSMALVLAMRGAPDMTIRLKETYRLVIPCQEKLR